MKNKYIMTNIQKYLLGNDKNLSNNVIGTVLAFSTKLDTETPLKITQDNTTALNTPVTISTLLFLDFRTGRIERYLINASIHTFGKSITLDVDFKNDVYFTWKGERYKIFHEFDHVGGDQAKFSLINLGDGKITQAFNLIFMVELFRDYLIYESSYNDGNIASLRKITSPITEKIEDINSKVKTSSSGTGHLTSEELEAINQSNEYRLNDFKPFKAECFINYKNKNKDNKHTILVPNNHTSIKELFNYGHVNIVYSNKKELPQIVKDFTRSFYIKNINNIHNISLRIRSWNYNITKRLKKDFNK